MSATEANTQRTLSSIELIALVGFSLCLGWMCLCFFWFFSDYAAHSERFLGDIVQLFAFAGITVGFIAQNFLAKRPTFNLFFPVFVSVVFLMGVFQPLVVLAANNIGVVPYGITCVAGLCAGLSAAALVTAWLDVLSRLERTSYARFTGLGFAIGSLAFFIAITAPDTLQPLFAVIYIICTVGLVLFCSRRANGNEDRVPLEQVADPWMFTREIEPSFFIFNVVFAFTIVFLFNSGPEYVAWGMVSIIPGALVIAALGFARISLSVTILQRMLLAITVLGCVALPFTDGYLQLACACLVMASWAAFMAANYALIVLKCATNKEAPLFRQAPARLAVPALGFAVGWGIATLLTAVAGTHASVFTVAHLVLAFLLVLTVMVFFPAEAHHPAGGGAAQEPKAPEAFVSIQMDESELFDRKCAAIVKMYQLSPRESDILAYLAKGRNAAWIQEQLVISPHTVKSHIYNIYRKLDIHSQQKLMSFVEEYPVDLTGE